MLTIFAMWASSAPLISPFIFWLVHWGYHFILSPPYGTTTTTTTTIIIIIIIIIIIMTLSPLLLSCQLHLAIENSYRLKRGHLTRTVVTKIFATTILPQNFYLAFCSHSSLQGILAGKAIERKTCTAKERKKKWIGKYINWYLH